MTAPVLTEPTTTLEQPQTKYATYEDYLALPSEGPLVEWVNGEVIQHMPPTDIHQNLSLYLAALLKFYVDFFGLGAVRDAPYEMKCKPDGNAREPDILFVAKDNLHRLSDGKRLLGPADLLVEIISDESVVRDYDDKFVEYEECGVQEYWIIDPRPRRKRATFYQRNRANLFEPVAPQDGVYRSRIVAGFWLDEQWLWDMPDALETFATIVGLPQPIMDALRDKKHSR
jgi:Uma2 family endonuclease